MSETELRDEVEAIRALTEYLAERVQRLDLRLNPGGGKTDYRRLSPGLVSFRKRDDEDDGSD